MTDEDALPVLDQLNPVVGDMAAAVDFYRRPGVDIADEADEWSEHRHAVDRGYAELWCRPHQVER